MDYRLEKLRDRHAGERCVLVANGPSLSHMDFRLFRREICIGMNKIYLGFKRFHFYPRYYVTINRYVIEQSVKEIKTMNCVKFVSRRGANGLIEEDALTYLVDTRKSGSAFCRDISNEGVSEGHTVTYAALQLAYFLGFREVIIVGMDHRYQYQGKPNEAKIMQGADPNHFSADYFGGGQTWNNPNLLRSEESYRIARRVYEQSNRRIIDATLNGACKVFERADYKNIFSTETQRRR
jgi:hypothetical protein